MAIGFSSRYYEPLQILRKKLDGVTALPLVYNSEKDTFSLPYLYENYKNEIEPEKTSRQIIQSLKGFFRENLFNEKEMNLILKELEPEIVNYGEKLIISMKNHRDLALEHNKSEIAKELQNTIDAFYKIREKMKKEYTMGKFTSSDVDGEPTVFISYSHDNEAHMDWVLQLATRLRANGVNVILDRWNLSLGKDLASFMEKGLSNSHRVICICSEKYVEKANGGIGGSGYEKQILTSALIKNQNTNYVIPLIKNNPSEEKTPIFLYGRVYINFDQENLYEKNYEELLRDILNEPILPIPPLGKNPFKNIKNIAKQNFLPSSEKYHSPAVKGEVTFDYSNNNGKYSIGQDKLLFELKFSKSSNTNIILYNDPPSIKSVAIAKGVKEISNIKDAREFDNSSRVRRPKLEEIAIIQNQNGFYAAIKIIKIKDDTRGNEKDEITFQYIIQSNGSPNFSNT